MFGLEVHHWNVVSVCTKAQWGEILSEVLKATSKSEGPKKFGVPEKKSSFFPYKRTAFFTGTPNFFGPSDFEAALVWFSKT